jgi:hypothetical protein
MTDTPASSPRSSWLDSVAMRNVGLSLALVNFIAQCVTHPGAQVDDAYFTFSFAKNLALGNGPTYSHGLRVEGYSTFLWMVLCSVAFFFTRGTHLIVAARIMEAPFVLLLGASVYALARRCGAPRGVAVLAPLLLSTDTDVVVAFLTGMETLPFMALVAAAFVTLALSLEDERWAARVPYVCLAVALMRIDGFSVAGFVGLCAVVDGLRKQQALRTIARRFAPAVALYVVWFLARWGYYGLPLPSTYYAKALIAQVLPNRGLEYVTAEVREKWLWLGAVAWCVLLWRRQVVAAVVGTFAVLHLGYVMTVGGDWMPFGRFVLPAEPLLLSVFVAALAAVGFELRARLWVAAPMFAAASLALCVAWAGRLDRRFLESAFEPGRAAAVLVQRDNVATYERMAEFVRAAVPAGANLVTDYGGVLSCLTDAALVEMWGLANADIARNGTTSGVNPIYGKTCPACYARLKPDFFHVMYPLLRPADSFKSHDEVVRAVWQHETIGVHVKRKSSDEALFLLKRRGVELVKEPSGDFVVDRPFSASAGG